MKYAAELGHSPLQVGQPGGRLPDLDTNRRPHHEHLVFGRVAIHAEELAEALRYQQPAAAAEFHRPMPRGKQTAKQLHLGNAIVAESFRLQFLFQQLDPGV